MDYDLRRTLAFSSLSSINLSRSLNGRACACVCVCVLERVCENIEEILDLQFGHRKQAITLPDVPKVLFLSHFYVAGNPAGFQIPQTYLALPIPPSALSGLLHVISPEGQVHPMIQVWD